MEQFPALRGVLLTLNKVGKIERRLEVYIDLVVTLDGKPETIKASCILYGASQDLKCGLLSTEGDGITHHIRVTFPVKITSSTQMTVTCGRKKTTFTLSVN